MWAFLLQQLVSGDRKALARCITLTGNAAAGHEELLQQLPANTFSKIIGITGAPGTGKSTLTDALIASYVQDKKKVGVLCVDPSSPFNLGALLGDRIRMSQWHAHPDVFIRSLATRGSLGGLTPRIIEITDLMKAGGFDYIIIETVGVGQSEIEITGVADITIVVLTPASGDEIQVMKAGVMEIADIFVVNKSDNKGADVLVKDLLQHASRGFKRRPQDIPVVKTIASVRNGIEELKEKITRQLASTASEKKFLLLAEKAYRLIQDKRMQDISREKLKEQLMQGYTEDFNLYAFVRDFDKKDAFAIR